MKVLVCGGREFHDWTLLDDTLMELDEKTPIEVIIQGDAKGADWLAKAWAKANWIHCESYPANWKLHNKLAGPVRNQQMLDNGQPDLVVAFPGGNGTADMIRRAKKAGVEVLNVAST